MQTQIHLQLRQQLHTWGTKTRTLSTQGQGQAPADLTLELPVHHSSTCLQLHSALLHQTNLWLQKVREECFYASADLLLTHLTWPTITAPRQQLPQERRETSLSFIHWDEYFKVQLETTFKQEQSPQPPLKCLYILKSTAAN